MRRSKAQLEPRLPKRSCVGPEPAHLGLAAIQSTQPENLHPGSNPLPSDLKAAHAERAEAQQSDLPAGDLQVEILGLLIPGVTQVPSTDPKAELHSDICCCALHLSGSLVSNPTSLQQYFGSLGPAFQELELAYVAAHAAHDEAARLRLAQEKALVGIMEGQACWLYTGDVDNVQ